MDQNNLGSGAGPEAGSEALSRKVILSMRGIFIESSLPLALLLVASLVAFVLSLLFRCY